MDTPDLPRMTILSQDLKLRVYTHFISLVYFYSHVFGCVCMGACVMVFKWRSESNLWKSVLSLHVYEGAEEYSQIVRLAAASYLVGYAFIFKVLAVWTRKIKEHIIE